jgi:hypothetical protein
MLPCTAFDRNGVLALGPSHVGTAASVSLSDRRYFISLPTLVLTHSVTRGSGVEGRLEGWVGKEDGYRGQCSGEIGGGEVLSSCR